MSNKRKASPERKDDMRNDRSVVSIDTVVSPDGVTSVTVTNWLRDVNGINTEQIEITDMAAFMTLARGQELVLDALDAQAKLTAGAEALASAAPDDDTAA